MTARILLLGVLVLLAYLLLHPEMMPRGPQVQTRPLVLCGGFTCR